MTNFLTVRFESDLTAQRQLPLISADRCLCFSEQDSAYYVFVTALGVCLTWSDIPKTVFYDTV